MPKEDGFITAIASDPYDVTAKLVYADWLEEQGDPRAEYLRVAFELASLSEKGSPVRGRKALSKVEQLQTRLHQLRSTINAEWLAQMGGMPRFLAVATARERMDELERFLTFWYGSRKDKYSEPPSRLQALPLPYPLRRFYAFAGRWPSPDPRSAHNYFYTGSGGHHLRGLGGVTVLPDGRLNFFMEYQGDWDGLTFPDADDPPVWIEGYWWEEADRDRDDDDQRVKAKQASDSLSKFLVTHCLMTTIYERENSPCSSSDEYLAEWFRGAPEMAFRIWSADDCDCPNYNGSFYLFHGCILVLQNGSYHRFGAIHPVGMALIKQHLRSDT